MLKLFIEHCKSFGAGLSPISVQANPFNTQAAFKLSTLLPLLSLQKNETRGQVRLYHRLLEHTFLGSSLANF